MSGEAIFECTSALPINVMVGEGTNSMLASRRVQPHAPYHPWPLAALQATKWSAKRRASEEPMAVRRSEVGTCGWLVSPGETPAAPHHPNPDPPPIPSPTLHHVVVLSLMQIQVLCTPWCPSVATCGLRREQDWMVLPQLRGLMLPPGPYASAKGRRAG
jgi:hypothetical protein